MSLIENEAPAEPTLYINLPAASPLRAVVITFDPAARPEEHSVYGDAAATQLVPVLRSVLARLESGALRMPVGDGAAWVSCEPEPVAGRGRA